MARKKKVYYVADFIKDVKKDLMPYGVTCIWSGVGSGKNTIIEGQHDSEVDVCGLIENYRVLLITSRKSKVTETASKHKDMFLTDVRDKDDYYLDVDGDKSIVCTSAHIATRIMKDWCPSPDLVEPFWRKFDFIVVDEFHSLIADATFSRTAFMMKCFVEKVYQDCIADRNISEVKTRMIFMSGTPAATEILLNNIQNKDIKTYELREKARYIKPKNMNFTYYNYARSQIKKVLKKHDSVVYYMCHHDKLEKLIELARSANIPDSAIAVSVSDDKTNALLEENYKDIFNNKKIVETALSTQMIIPESIKLFITNSKNKEGINIKNNPALLVVEHRYTDDIIQICGRFRNQIKNVIVLFDARQFLTRNVYPKEATYQSKYAIHAANSFFESLAKSHDIDLEFFPAHTEKALKDFIDFIESSTPYLRFNYFTNKFEYNVCFYMAEREYNKQVDWFNKTVEDYKQHRSFDFGDMYYRDINVFPTLSPDKEDLMAEYIRKNKIVLGETVFTQKKGLKLLDDLAELRGLIEGEEDKPYKNIGSMLTFFGYKKVQHGRTSNKEFTIIKLDNRKNF